MSFNKITILFRSLSISGVLLLVGCSKTSVDEIEIPHETDNYDTSWLDNPVQVNTSYKSVHHTDYVVNVY